MSIYTFAKSLLFVLLIEFSYHECFIYIYPRLAVKSRLESPQTNGGVSITTKYSFDSFIGSSGLFTFIHINRPAIQKFTTYGHYFCIFVRYLSSQGNSCTNGDIYDQI